MKSYFKIKTLEIENWGPYLGTHRLEFSIDEVKNVTYILGVNGAGKTNFFQAMKWVLFYEKDFRHIDEKASILDVLNNNIKDQHIESTYIRAKIIFESFISNRKYFYEVERIQYFNYNLKLKMWEIGREQFNAIKDDDLERKKINENQYLADINKYFPVGPRDFFFLDGEKMASNFSRANMDRVTEFTINMSDIPKLKLLKTSVDHFNEFILKKREVQKRNQKKKGNSRESNLEDEIDKINKKIDEIQTKIKNKESEFEAINKRIADYEDQINAGKEKVPDINKELNKIRSEIEEKEAELSYENNELSKYLSQNGAFIILQNEMKDCLADINDKKQKKILPKILDTSIIDQILQSDECICGRPILREIKEYLLKQKLDAPARNEIIEIENFEKKIISKLDSIKDWKKFCEEKCHNINIIQGELQEKNEIILRLNLEISNYTDNPEQFMDLFNKYREESTIKGEISQKIKDLKEELKKLKDEKDSKIEKLEKLKTKMDDTDPEDQILRNQIRIIEKISDKIEELKIKMNELIIQNLVGLVFKNWVKLIEDKDAWESIIIENINDSWQIQPKKKKMNNPPILSQGQKHILGISFLTSLASLFGNQYPLVFDSPFGRLGKTPIINIGKELPSLLNGSQVILFVTDTEDGGIYEKIENSIGFEYKLNKIEDSNITEILNVRSV
jgi:DNA sulfur modification protein DndD